MKNLTIASLVTALTIGSFGVLGASSAYAQQGEGHGMGQNRPTFEEMDTDGDGQISKEEMEAGRKDRFAEMDADGDGLVSKDELIAHMSAKMAERVDEMFERLDTDGDGFLSQEELEAAREGKRGHGKGRFGKRGG